MAVRLFYSLPGADAAHSTPSQTPVVLQDEDILSDVVPSNIVSRQVYSRTNARNFQGFKTLPTFLIGYSRGRGRERRLSGRTGTG